MTRSCVWITTWNIRNRLPQPMMNRLTSKSRLSIRVLAVLLASTVIVFAISYARTVLAHNDEFCTDEFIRDMKRAVVDLDDCQEDALKLLNEREKTCAKIYAAADVDSIFDAMRENEDYKACIKSANSQCDKDGFKCASKYVQMEDEALDSYQRCMDHT